jgi:hypothetical protein
VLFTAGVRGFAPGLTFCLTGTLSMQKSKVEAMIKAHGGKVCASLDRACSCGSYLWPAWAVDHAAV